jgi:hypothetical protein
MKYYVPTLWALIFAVAGLALAITFRHDGPCMPRVEVVPK